MSGDYCPGAIVQGAIVWEAIVLDPSPGTPASFTNKTDRHDITEILLKVALNTINQAKPIVVTARIIKK